MTRLLFVGECRSLTAQRKGWTWKDGRLAAKPLFEALEAMGVDPSTADFCNAFHDPPTKRNVRGWVPAPNEDTLTALWAVHKVRTVVALGKRVSAELAKRGIDHVALVHPAARGKIRKRERYHAHVKSKLEEFTVSHGPGPETTAEHSKRLVKTATISGAFPRRR